MKAPEHEIEQHLRNVMRTQGEQAHITDVAGAARVVGDRRRRRGAFLAGSSAVAGLAAAAVVAIGLTAPAPGPASATSPKADIALSDVQLTALAKTLTSCPAGQVSDLKVGANEPVKSLVDIEANPLVVWEPEDHRPPHWTPAPFLVNGERPPASSQWWYGYSRSGQLVYDVYVDGARLARTADGSAAPAQHISAVSCAPAGS